MPPMGGHGVQWILAGAANGLELSTRPLCEIWLKENCTRGRMRLALFLSYIGWSTWVKNWLWIKGCSRLALSTTKRNRVRVLSKRSVINQRGYILQMVLMLFLRTELFIIGKKYYDVPVEPAQNYITSAIIIATEAICSCG